MNRGELFWHDFGPRSSHLQEGRRPVLVVQVDALNRLAGYGNVIIVPLTSKFRPSATYVRIEPSVHNQLEVESWAICNQVFTISKEDLKESLGLASSAEVYEIGDALKVAMGLK